MKSSVLGLVLLALIAGAARAQDAAHGKALFAKCARCHSLKRTENDLGPHLKGVVGRKAAAVKAFTYSAAMRHSAIIWDEQTLNAYLAEPRIVVPRTSMPNSAGLEDANDRQDLIAFLKTQ